MTVLDDLIATAEARDGLAQAVRDHLAILRRDGDLITTLIELRDVSVPRLTAALTAQEDIERSSRRLPAPGPPVGPSDDDRLCAFTTQTIGECDCTTCSARRGSTATSSEVENLEDPNLGSGHCRTSGKPALACTCPDHTAWRASGHAGDQNCRTCGDTVPIADIPRSGGGWSKDCRPCMAARNAKASKGRGRRQREASSSKEPV